MESGSFKYIPEPQSRALIPAPKKLFPINLPKKKLLVLAGAAALVLCLAYWRLIAAPASFPSDTILAISKGETLSGSVQAFADTGMIRSSFGLKAFIVLFGGTHGVQAGDYYFKSSENAIIIAWRITHSQYELQNIKVTIPEGFNLKQIADLFSKQRNLTHFNKNEFIKIAALYEGYLFPDTYLLLPNVTAQDVVNIMIANYKTRVGTLQSDIAAFNRPIQDIITMASILEEEGRTMETRQIIAGILWKRLDKKMPLQVDSTIVYLTGKKDGNALSQEDFKIDSPYNTYVNKGLPPTPISNPGLDSIKAAIHPIATKYFYYITDPQGIFHGAMTYDEQIANEQQFLNQ